MSSSDRIETEDRIEITDHSPGNRDANSETVMMAWLRLMRLPTVFTALSNILCGYLVTHDASLAELLQQSQLYLLLLASAGLYLGGMVLNDVFDAQLDAIERPERPIPSGNISRRAALIFGNLLLVIGIAAAGMVSSVSLQIAAMLAVAVVAYDTVLKNTAAGSFGMATCRFLNLLLGSSAVGGWTDLLRLPQLGIAGALGLYILGVTWFARNEAGNSSRRSMWIGLIVVLAGIAADGGVIAVSDFPHRSALGGGIALGLIAANVVLRGAGAIQDRQPRIIQKTVGFMLLSIILLDAAMVFAASGRAAPAALIAVLVIPATLMKRVIPLS